MKIIRLLTVLSFFITTASCSVPPEQQIIGVWVTSDGSHMEFSKDGTFTVKDPKTNSLLSFGTYALLGNNQLKIEHNGFLTFVVKWSIENDKLITIFEGEQDVMVRYGSALSKKITQAKSEAEKEKSLLEQKAIAFAKEAWDREWLQIGESWFVKRINGGFMQVKGRTIETNAQELTEADKLNGIEFISTVKFHCKAKRFYYPKKNYSSLLGWQPWRSESKDFSGNIVPTQGFVIQKKTVIGR